MTTETVRALVVTTAGDAEVRHVAPKLDTLQAIVGGWVEPIKLPGGVIMFGNEEAAITNLPPNVLATRIIEALAQQSMHPPGNVLRGDVVFFAREAAPDSDFEVGDCPQAVLDLAHALT